MKITSKIDGYYVIGEYFEDMSQIEPVLRTRNQIHGMEHDFLCQPDSARSGDESFYGFDKVGELRDAIAHGIFDEKAIDIMTDTVSGNDESGVNYEDEYDVSGEEFDADRYYAYEPECMTYREYQEGLTPRLNIVVEMDVHCGIEHKDIMEASAYILRLVRTLEKNDTRVELIGASGTYDGSHDDDDDDDSDDDEEYDDDDDDRNYGDLFLFMVAIKHADEPVNYPTLLVLANTMFDRGIGFGWITRSTKYMSGYGRPACYNVKKKTRTKAYRQIYGPIGKTVVVTLKDLIDKLHECRSAKMNKAETDEAVDKWLAEDIKMQVCVEEDNN